eukprot:26746-Prorocentrum_minimum.AAC.1
MLKWMLRGGDANMDRIRWTNPDRPFHSYCIHARCPYKNRQTFGGTIRDEISHFSVVKWRIKGLTVNCLLGGDSLQGPGPEFFANLPELFLHERLLTSSHRTLNPREADFFFVPAYTGGGRKLPGGMRAYLGPCPGETISFKLNVPQLFLLKCTLSLIIN